MKIQVCKRKDCAKIPQCAMSTFFVSMLKRIFDNDGGKNQVCATSQS